MAKKKVQSVQEQIAVMFAGWWVKRFGADAPAPHWEYTLDVFDPDDCWNCMEETVAWLKRSRKRKEVEKVFMRKLADVKHDSYAAWLKDVSEDESYK